MAKTREAFTTPLGRIVQGDVFVAQTKDQQGNLRVFKSGPNVGQPNPQFFIAVAFPKKMADGSDNHEFNAFYALLDRVARAEWPALFPTPGQPCVNPMFTMKVKDGDGTDRNGKSNATKPGFAGHWVVSFASQYAPKAVRPLVPNPVNPQDWENLSYDPAAGAKPIKCGDWVRVAGSTSGNDSPNTPGLYVNLDMVELLGIGEAIVSGPDAAGAFGGAGAPAALPAGVTSAIGAPPAPGAAAAFAGPGGAAAPPPPGTPAAAPPAGPVMLPAAGATTYDQYRAAGWTDEQLIANGYMAAAAPPPGNAPPPPGAAGATVPAAPAAPNTNAPGAPTSPPPYDGYMQPPGNDPAQSPGAGAPPPPASAPGATASPTSRMTATAGGKSFEEFIAAGWTEAQLVQHGYMTAA